jgi:site-specific DNA-methyltransferase (adenine-specific)
VSIEYRIGDVFERLAEIPDGTIDLVVTSPPFLALRSYLPADHPDKHKEIGSEPTPAEFIDTLLALTAEWGRVLAPHGSVCCELGDTYSGNMGGTKHRTFTDQGADYAYEATNIKGVRRTGEWPKEKSLTGIPTLYPWSLAYGRNLLTGEPSPAGQWRIRNVIVWARPNPPVGALGDKFRPATSYITVACKGSRRYFDLDAVRTPHARDYSDEKPGGLTEFNRRLGVEWNRTTVADPAGAPPLDWHTDDHPEDGDWLWKLSTQPYKGSHYATFPLTLPRRLIEAMCPLRVCVSCGKPSERITRDDTDRDEQRRRRADGMKRGCADRADGGASTSFLPTNNVTLGWSDCGHNTWRTGTVLDPFAGSGTTLEAAQLVGRHAIGIDLDSRNAELARDRVGMFLTVVDAA